MQTLSGYMCIQSAGWDLEDGELRLTSDMDVGPTHSEPLNERRILRLDSI